MAKREWITDGWREVVEAGEWYWVKTAEGVEAKPSRVLVIQGRDSQTGAYLYTGGLGSHEVITGILPIEEQPPEPEPVLKHCPFCAAFRAKVQSYGPQYYVECMTCEARGPLARVEAGAIEGWQVRMGE